MTTRVINTQDDPATRRDAQRIRTRLIDKQRRPCEMCGETDPAKLVIHRKRPGYLGGKYTLKNCQVLCINCHRHVTALSKFNVGDKVTINGRCPKFIYLSIRRNRYRTITAIYYDPERQCNYYYLGGNNAGQHDDVTTYRFRSYQLQYIEKRNPGRPKTKRKYNRHNLATKRTTTQPLSQLDTSTERREVIYSPRITTP